MEKLLLSHWRAPGDVTCMTACVRDLVKQYPARFEIHIAGSHPELWTFNPHITHHWNSNPPHEMRSLRLSARDAMVDCDKYQMHYLTAFHRDLSQKLGLDVAVLEPKGDLHLSREEISTPLFSGRYWLVAAGGKDDMQAKIWPSERFQKVVDNLASSGIRFVQAGATKEGHRNPKLENVVNYVGKTNLREFLRLVYHSEGVLCHVSFPMHIAAAFDKPCVVVAGGREPPWWEEYTNPTTRQFGERCASIKTPHHFLHTVGSLDCCRGTGCWKSGISQTANSDNCLFITSIEGNPEKPVPQCMATVSVNLVCSAILVESELSSNK